MAVMVITCIPARGKLTPMLLQVIQHVPFEGPACIADWAQSKGHQLRMTRMFADDPLPQTEQFDWLIVMGGPMGVADEAQCPWLGGEKRLIRDAIEQNKTVLGICLGAQLIAACLGARVFPNQHKEIGWFPVHKVKGSENTPLGRVLPDEIEALHWHGDTFGLPNGAVHLARSDACLHQAFAVGDRVLALQFHLEMTPASAEALSRQCEYELVRAPYIQTAETILSRKGRFDAANAVMYRLLDHLHEATTQ